MRSPSRFCVRARLLSSKVLSFLEMEYFYFLLYYTGIYEAIGET